MTTGYEHITDDELLDMLSRYERLAQQRRERLAGMHSDKYLLEEVEQAELHVTSIKNEMKRRGDWKPISEIVKVDTVACLQRIRRSADAMRVDASMAGRRGDEQRAEEISILAGMALKSMGAV